MAIQYSYDIVKNQIQPDPNVFEEENEETKFNLKIAAVVLTLFDLLLCGTKSSWCKKLKPVQKVIFVLPIFIDIGSTIQKVYTHTKDTGDGKGLTLGLSIYCSENVSNNKIDSLVDKKAQEAKAKTRSRTKALLLFRSFLNKKSKTDGLHPRRTFIPKNIKKKNGKKWLLVFIQTKILVMILQNNPRI